MCEQEETKKSNKTVSILPWLRFVVNIIFYIILIRVIIHAGNKLWINTLPQEPKAINELIKVIKENTKTVTTQRHSKEKTEVEQEFKDSSPSYYRNPNWLPSLNSARTTIETSKAEDVPESYTIQKDDLDNALKSVALASRQEVAEDYHKNFSILVAILAIFGIGFPIIVALVQHSFNDRDLDKIEKTAIQTNKASNDAEKAVIDANNAITTANNSLKNAEKNFIESKELKIEILNLSQTFNDEIKYLDALFSAFLGKQDNERFHNISALIYLRYIFFDLKGLENKIINDESDSCNVKNKLSNICSNIEKLLDRIKNLKDKDEFIKAKLVRGNCIWNFNRYIEILNKIKINLPKDFHEDIENLNKKIQEAKNIVLELNKTTKDK